MIEMLFRKQLFAQSGHSQMFVHDSRHLAVTRKERNFITMYRTITYLTDKRASRWWCCQTSK